MNALTEEQRRRIELNRQRALEKGKRRKNSFENENFDRIGAFQQQPRNDGHGHAAAVATCSMVSNNRPERESFGDGGIDWEVAVGEMDRLLSATSSRATTQSNNHHSNNATAAHGLPNGHRYPSLDTKRRKLGNENSQTHTPQHGSQISGLTEGQRTRMEENRRKALEKKQQKSSLSSSKPSLLKSTTDFPSQAICNDDQRARMEENRRKALAEKQQMSSKLTPSPLPLTTTIEKKRATAYNDEQRARIEENRRKALEKKQQKSQLASAKTQNALLCNDDQRARIRMEENRRRALEKKQQKSQLASVQVKANTQNASLCNADQRARIEENRRKALEKKKQKLQAAKGSIGTKSTSVSSIIHYPNSTSYSDEQRARIEENRRKALEKKRQHNISPVRNHVSPVPARPAPALPKSTIPCTLPTTFNDRHRSRMEENRRKALEKRKQMSQLAVPASILALPKNNTQGPSTTIPDDHRAKIEKNKRKAFEKEMQRISPVHKHVSPFPVLSEVPTLPTNNVQCPLPRSSNDDHQVNMMEGNEQKALEKKEPSPKVATSASMLVLSENCTQCPFPTTTGHRVRVEEVKRKAFEKEMQHFSPISSQVSPFPVQPLNTTHCQLLATFNDDHRAKVEGNCQLALEKRELLPQIAVAAVAPLPTTSIQCPSSTITDEYRAQMEGRKPDEHTSPVEESRAEVLDGKERLSKEISEVATSLLPNNSQCPSTKTEPKRPPCPSLVITEDLLGRMEESEQSDSGDEQPMTQDASPSKLDPPHDAQVSSQPSVPGLDSNDASGIHTCQENSKIDSRTEKQRASEDRPLECQEQTMPAPAPSSDACVPHNDTHANPSQKVDTPGAVPFELDGEKSASVPTPIKAASPKKPDLPKLPEEIQYEESRVGPIIDGYTDTLIENAELDKPELLNGMCLYEHQKEGVLRALRMRRLILAFDMGLGKTIIGCVWAKAFRDTFAGIKIFLVAPPSVHVEWMRTATEAVGLTATAGKKSKPKPKKKKKTTAKTRQNTATGKKRAKKIESDSEDEEECEASNNFDIYVFSWNSISAYKDIIREMGVIDYVVICDEAHSMQSMETKRTKEALKLVYPKKCRGVLLLSGTPMKNGRPLNLFPLLKAVKHPFGDKQKDYEFFFCNGQQKTVARRGNIWDANGSSNLTELNAHTRSHIFRLTKEECMELSPRNRELKEIPVSARHKLRYTQALKDLAKAFSSSQPFPSGENDEVLSSFQKLRHMSSMAKIDATVALCKSIVEEESSLVVFTTFVAVAEEVHQKLEGMGWAGELLTGKTPSQKRQAMVDKFQSGLSPVFVCTYGAGGVGLTLTAACTVVLVDRPWTPGDVCQAEDRVRRIGQKRATRSIWIRAFPIDKQIDNLIHHKAVNSNSVVDGKGHDGKNKSAPKVSIAELVKSVLNDQENGFD
mmetsp:Transcript_34703/g.73149  ORF Transcript_34703/g.73149 Transcript_34703/m.73149 type:complete len:1418 (+) Transcript_34703:228-4481(+)